MGGGGYGIVGDIIVGIIGAFIGGWLFSLIGIGAVWLIGSIIVAFGGACILIALLRLISGSYGGRGRRTMECVRVYVYTHEHERGCPIHVTPGGRLNEPPSTFYFKAKRLLDSITCLNRVQEPPSFLFGTTPELLLRTYDGTIPLDNEETKGDKLDVTSGNPWC